MPVSGGGLLVPSDRVVERKQGCWNCIHHANSHTDEPRLASLWSAHKAGLVRKLRESRMYDRQQLAVNPDATLMVARLRKQGVDQDTAIEAATREALNQDPRFAIIQKVEDDIASGALGICTAPGGPAPNAAGEVPGDFIYSAFLCSKWTARSGASVARGTDKADLLPDELRDRIDGDLPKAKP